MTAMEDNVVHRRGSARQRQTGFSRIPIHHENIDRIVSIAHQRFAGAGA